MTKYYLNIHHRDITADGKKSPGHFYVSLEFGGTKKSFGAYPSQRSTKSCIGKIEIRDERDIDEECKSIGKEHVFSKQLELTKDNYEKAFEYIKKIQDSAGSYTVWNKNCVKYVQDIYHAVGGKLFFSVLYNRAELQKLGTAACNSVLLRYGSKDNFKDHSIDGRDVQQVADMLNIDPDKVKICTENTSNHSVGVNLLPSSYNALKFFVDVTTQEIDEILKEKLDIQSPFYLNIEDINKLISDPEALEAHRKEAMDSAKKALEEAKKTHPILKNLECGQPILSAEDISNLFPKYSQSDLQFAADLSEQTEKAMQKQAVTEDMSYLFPKPSSEDTKWATDLAKESKNMMQQQFANIFGALNLNEESDRDEDEDIDIIGLD